MGKLVGRSTLKKKKDCRWNDDRYIYMNISSTSLIQKRFTTTIIKKSNFTTTCRLQHPFPLLYNIGLAGRLYDLYKILIQINGVSNCQHHKIIPIINNKMSID